MPDKLIEGVFVDGKPLEEFLIDQERDAKSKEIEEVRKASEHYQKATIVYGDEKRSKEDTRRVAKRVKYYTDREIRKEYGIMKKPFDSHAENAIWVMWEKGPINTTDIGKEIEYPGSLGSLSAMVSTIWKRLGNMHTGAMDIISRENHHGTYHYQKKPGIDVSVEQAIEKYRLAGSAQWKRKQSKKKQTKQVNSAPKDMSEEIVEHVVEVVNKHVGLEVKVNGRIDVVFSWQK
jgi:hypothetical protein